MIVILEDGLFADPELDPAVYQVALLGLDERHHMQTDQPYFDPAGDAPVNHWLRRQTERMRAAFEHIFEVGYAIETTGAAPRPTLRVRVAALARPEWSQPEPRLPIDIARRLLTTSLKLLVENRRNDGAFVRACAQPVLRERLQHAEEQGWLEFENGGGLPEILARVKEVNGDPLLCARLWVLFDSDSRVRFDPAPDRSTSERFQQPVDPAIPRQFGPSKVSREVVRACHRARGHIRWHQLRRRAIENYAPGRLLQAWSKRDRDRARKVDRFLNRLNGEQRHYFNMKKDGKRKGGFSGDRKSKEGIAPIYGDELCRDPHLAEGFAGLADYFDDKKQRFRIDRAWFRDQQLDELDPVIASIFEHL